AYADGCALYWVHCYGTLYADSCAFPIGLQVRDTGFVYLSTQSYLVGYHLDAGIRDGPGNLWVDRLLCVDAYSQPFYLRFRSTAVFTAQSWWRDAVGASPAFDIGPGSAVLYASGLKPAVVGAAAATPATVGGTAVAMAAVPLVNPANLAQFSIGT